MNPVSPARVVVQRGRFRDGTPIFFQCGVSRTGCPVLHTWRMKTPGLIKFTQRHMRKPRARNTLSMTLAVVGCRKSSALYCTRKSTSHAGPIGPRYLPQFVPQRSVRVYIVRFEGNPFETSARASTACIQGGRDLCGRA